MSFGCSYKVLPLQKSAFFAFKLEILAEAPEHILNTDPGRLGVDIVI